MPETEHNRRCEKLKRAIFLRRLVLFLICLSGWLSGTSGQKAGAAETNYGFPEKFTVRNYIVHGNQLLPADTLTATFSKYTGNVALPDVVQAAAALQAAYLKQGYLPVSVAVAPGSANDIITLNVFQAMEPQIVVSGKRYLESSAVTNSMLATAAVKPSVAIETNQITPAVSRPLRPATPEEMAAARAALFQKMAELNAAAKDTRVHVVSTNTGPHFEVQKYLVAGNSVLTPGTIAETLTNIDGAYGTNVSFDGIRTVVTELQAAYRERGYVTVAVGLPQQKLTNATVKVQVTEGRLAVVAIKGNRYFSDDNIRRALPSLHTNTILNGLVFQAELNRANANQDRQIYPQIGPGPDPGTSALTLKVKDQLPLHAKMELNNESSPGTPDLRLNTSAVYDNLWQDENALGIQYSFSPQDYKTVSPTVSDLDHKEWNFYDQPLVANYSMFYRLPLGNPEPVEKIIADNPTSFGYDEATRKFNLPPPTGQPDLTFYASRSTIDTGLIDTGNTTLANTNGNIITKQTMQQDLTENNDLGFRLNIPLKTTADYQNSFSGGLDFKDYNLTSYKTNQFTENGVEYNPNSGQSFTNITAFNSPVPVTDNRLQYLPLSLRYDETRRDSMGYLSLGVGLSANLWYDSSTQFPTSTNSGQKGLASLQTISGSAKTTGHWFIVTPTLTRVINVYTNWPLTIRADGQWASEPLISNEQFGIGGVNSVRGYREGEVFGDTGWHVSLEQQTAPYTVGPAYGNVPLVVRGSVYMDYARAFLIDPQGRPGSTALWGTGFGGVASVGPHWQARLLFSLPLLKTTLTQAYQPYFNFSLTAQF